MPLPAAAVPLMVAGMQTAGNIAGGLIGSGKRFRQQKALAKQANKYNRSMQEMVYEQNLAMMHYQNEYNSPEAQRKRYEEAGMNPALAYGTGNPGNQSSAPEMKATPAVVPDAQDLSFLGSIGTQFAQARVLASQADLNNQKVTESGVKQQLMEIQKQVQAANPMLNAKVYFTTLQAMVASAQVKRQESEFLLKSQSDASAQTMGERKVQYEIENLVKRFDLNTQDLKIKNQVLESKEFQNALQEIQLKWMRDGEITSQHIYQFVMMMLMKSM